MRRALLHVAAIAAVLGALPLAACSSHNRAERAGRHVDDAVDKVDRKTDRAEDKVEHGVDRAKDKADRAVDELKH